MRRTLLAAAALALLGVPPAADAEVRIARDTVELVAFAGRGVAYDVTRPVVRRREIIAYKFRLLRWRPGGRRDRLASLGRSVDVYSKSGYDNVRWDTSGSHVVASSTFTNWSRDGSADGTTVRAGRLGRPVRRRLMRCSPYGYDDPPPVAVWQNVGAYNNGCGGRGDLVVRRLDRPDDPPQLTLSAYETAIDIAGPYVALGTTGGIEVWDRRSGTHLYTADAQFLLPGRGVGGATHGAGRFEVQADGKVAGILFYRDNYCVAAWFSPAEPRAHLVGRTPCHGDVRLSRDQIAWVRVRRGRGALVIRELGGGDHVVARFPVRRPARHSEILDTASTVSPYFAFDGRRIAYSVGRCDGRSALLLRTRLGAPVFRDRDPMFCPFRVTRRRLVVRRGAKVVRVPVRCPRGCYGRTSGPGWIGPPFYVRPGGRRIRVYLDDRTRWLLANRRGWWRKRVKFSIGGRAVGRIAKERAVTLRLRGR